MVLRIGDVQFDRTPRHQISNLMQLALVHVLSPGWLSTRWTGAVARIASLFDNLGSGQVFDPLIRCIGFVLARTVFRYWLDGCGACSHPASLLQKPCFAQLCVGRPATVSKFLAISQYSSAL
jgi:hypothetical protein